MEDCVICKESFDEFITLPCSHTYCDTCFKAWYGKEGSKSICCYCTQPFNLSDYIKFTQIDPTVIINKETFKKYNNVFALIHIGEVFWGKGDENHFKWYGKKQVVKLSWEYSYLHECECIEVTKDNNFMGYFQGRDKNYHNIYHRYYAVSEHCIKIYKLFVN